MEEEKKDVNQKSKKKIYIISAAAIVLVLAVVIGVYVSGKWGKVKKTTLDEKSLAVSKILEEDLDGNYLNVALFGINIKGDEDSAVDSDAVYIVSIGLDAKKVSVVSVYGNTILGADSGEKIRVKDAYAEGGAEKAIALLNSNLDLDIQKYAAVNFKAMADMIDILGGVEIDVTEEEVPHVDGYTRDISSALQKDAVKIESAGMQTLNGIQAVGYCRIRITEGGDVRRGSRQQAVIEQMLSKLKAANFSQMDDIVDAVFPQAETNFELKEAAAYGKDIASYTIGSIKPFPAQIKPQTRDGGKDGDYAENVECADYENDVVKLHESLFEGIQYKVSEHVKKNAEILK